MKEFFFSNERTFFSDERNFVVGECLCLLFYLVPMTVFGKNRGLFTGKVITLSQ